MFNSFKVSDQDELEDENFDLWRFKDKELKRYLLPSKFSLISSDDHTYGPFGIDSFGKKPVTIQIDNGEVLAQATSSFLYDYGRKLFKSLECFSFYVSNEIKISGVADISPT